MHLEQMKQRAMVSLWDCPNCGTITGPQTVTDEGSCEQVCRECAEDCTRAGVRAADWISIGLYMTERRYGGPEEGGWFFTAGSLERGTARQFREEDLEEAVDYFNRLQAEADRYNKATGSNTMSVECYVQATAPKYFPERRPYYC